MDKKERLRKVIAVFLPKGASLLSVLPEVAASAILRTIGVIPDAVDHDRSFTHSDFLPVDVVPVHGGIRTSDLPLRSTGPRCSDLFR